MGIGRLAALAKSARGPEQGGPRGAAASRPHTAITIFPRACPPGRRSYPGPRPLRSPNDVLVAFGRGGSAQVLGLRGIGLSTEPRASGSTRDRSCSCVVSPRAVAMATGRGHGRASGRRAGHRVRREPRPPFASARAWAPGSDRGAARGARRAAGGASTPGRPDKTGPGIPSRRLFRDAASPGSLGNRSQWGESRAPCVWARIAVGGSPYATLQELNTRFHVENRGHSVPPPASGISSDTRSAGATLGTRLHPGCNQRSSGIHRRLFVGARGHVAGCRNDLHLTDFPEPIRKSTSALRLESASLRVKCSTS